MEPYTLWLWPAGNKTRLRLTRGREELMRAELPPLLHIPNARAVVTLVEGLALWLDRPLRVVLCANASGTTYWLGLTDSQACGARSLYYEVQLVEPRGKRQAGQVSGFGGEWVEEWEQLSLWSPVGGQS